MLHDALIAPAMLRRIKLEFCIKPDCIQDKALGADLFIACVLTYILKRKSVGLWYSMRADFYSMRADVHYKHGC